MAYPDPDLHNDPDPDPDPDPNEPNDIRNLRRKANRADALARENAFLKAGINVETPLGALFAQGYGGELETEAIKTAFAAVSPPAPEPDPDPNPDPDPVSAEDREAAERRAALLRGGDPNVDNAPDRDPRKVALEHGEKLLAEGKSREEAMATMFSELASAAAAGDDRVIL